MDTLRIEHKAKFVGRLDYITRLEEKCASSETLSGKKLTYVGTIVRVNERGTELGTLAIAEYDTTLALCVFANQGIVELLMKELNGCDQIVVFEQEDFDLIQKHNCKGIKIVLE